MHMQDLACTCVLFNAGKDTANGHGDQSAYGQEGFGYDPDDESDEYEVSLQCVALLTYLLAASKTCTGFLWWSLF
jgi:hypothetical protein